MDLPRLTPDRRRSAAAMLADAFMDDPLFTWLLPRARPRHRWLRALMGAGLGTALPHGHVLLPGTGGGGAAVLMPPGAYPPPTARQLRMGLSLLWASTTAAMPPRSVAAAGRALARIDELHPSDSHWYVSILGVDPTRQGEGLGRRLMNGACALADADGLPLYLETSNPANLGFYARFGLRVVDEVRLDGGVPPIWTLQRPTSPGS